jgi:hypothetical protein
MHSTEWKTSIPTDSLLIVLATGRYPISAWPFDIRNRPEGKSLHIRIPENQSQFWMVYSGKSRKDSVLIRFDQKLRYADGACGFFPGFENLIFQSFQGSYFGNVQSFSQKGDTSHTVHALFIP